MSRSRQIKDDTHKSGGARGGVHPLVPTPHRPVSAAAVVVVVPEKQRELTSELVELCRSGDADLRWRVVKGVTQPVEVGGNHSGDDMQQFFSILRF